MKRNLKSRNGITLIALIITIIILLILAMVTINILINQGIIGHANNAVRGYEVAEEKEQITLAYQNYKMDKVNKDDAKLKVPGANGDQDIEQDDDDTWYILFDKTGHGYELNENGDVSKVEGERWTKTGDGQYTKNGTTIKIGDYVDYTYDEVEDGYLVESKYSGYKSAGGTEYDQTVKASGKLVWRILDISKDKVTVVCENSNSAGSLIFQGATGYNNAVFLLNDICEKLYSSQALGVTARSINIEDIEKQMTEEGKRQKNECENQYGRKLGDTRTDTGGSSWYPELYAYERGSGVNSETTNQGGIGQSDSYYETPTTNSSLTAEEKGITITQTAYKLSKSEESVSWFRNQVAHDLIFYGSYWIASRCVNLGGDYSSLGKGYSLFTGQDSKTISYHSIYSFNYNIWNWRYVRPILELGPNIIIGSEGGTSSNPRSLTLQQ